MDAILKPTFMIARFRALYARKDGISSMKSCTASFGLGRIIPFPSGSLALFHNAFLCNSSSTAPCPIGGKATLAGNFACATAGYGGGGGGIGTDTSVAPLVPSCDAADVVPEGTTVADATDTAPAGTIFSGGISGGAFQTTGICDVSDVVPEETTVSAATDSATKGTIFGGGVSGGNFQTTGICGVTDVVPEGTTVSDAPKAE